MSRAREQAKFCPYCGKRLSSRSKFCPHCGKASPRRNVTSSVIVGEVDHFPGPTGEGVEKPRTIILNRPGGPAAAVDATGAGNNSARATVTPITARRNSPGTHSPADAFEQAGFGLRYGAWMFDFLITLIAIMTFTFVVTAVSQRAVVGSNRDLLIVAGLTLLLFVLNFVVLAGRDGQSAGMRILGIFIMREDGKPFTMKDAAKRHLLGYPLSMAAFFLGFLWMLWDPRQQGWHDKLARTIVVLSK